MFIVDKSYKQVCENVSAAKVSEWFLKILLCSIITFKFSYYKKK